LTVSKPNGTRRRIRKCPRHARLVQLKRILQGQWGLSAKQLARRMKVSTNSVRIYLKDLVLNKTVIINFKQNELNSKRPTFYYALKRIK
jgi:predicted ArsR family transcriptional regulator